MMKITRRLRILVLVVALAAVGTVFAGCGGEPANDPLMEEPAPMDQAPADDFDDPGF